MPEPAVPLGEGGRAWEIQASFANSFQVSQAQGRTLVADDQFQVVLGDGVGEGFVLLDRPDPAGFADPYLGLRYAFPGTPGGWRFSSQVAVKPPIADEEEFRSTGSVDFGGQLTIDRHWSHHALILNVAAVKAGRFRFTESFEPPLLTSATLSYLYRFQKTVIAIQGLVAENAFSDLGGSALGDLELQVTLGLKRTTSAGVFGIAFTENISNFDNTPDIGLHLTWGLVHKGSSR